MPQHAVAKGYWKSEYLRAQSSSASNFVVTKPGLAAAAHPWVDSWSQSSPFEGSLLPAVDERRGEHAEEQQHLDTKPCPPQALEEHRPRVEEDRLDVEDHEEDGREVELHGQLDVLRAGALRAALVGLALLG
jgi:hypothetical protein